MTERPVIEHGAEALYDDYDNLIVKCVPHYREILETIAGKIDDAGETLDIGIGTGNLEEFIFKKFPQAKVTGVDTSPDFLKTAKKKHDTKQLRIIQADIINYEMGERRFSAILASLAIHHFEDNEKKALFEKIHRALKEGGSFINFDMIQPDTKEEDLRLREELFQRWRDQGLTEDFIRQEKKEMAERDRLVTLSEQRKWLEEIGFSFEVVYEDGFFCVYRCKKIKKNKIDLITN